MWFCLKFLERGIQLDLIHNQEIKGKRARKRIIKRKEVMNQKEELKMYLIRVKDLIKQKKHHQHQQNHNQTQAQTVMAKVKMI